MGERAFSNNRIVLSVGGTEPRHRFSEEGEACDPWWTWIQNLPISCPSMPVAAMAPLPRIFDERSIHRIGIDVAEYDRDLPETGEDA